MYKQDVGSFSSCDLMVNAERRQNRTALSGSCSTLEQFPFFYAYLEQFGRYEIRGKRHLPAKEEIFFLDCICFFKHDYLEF